jgi:hypothetical protein
MTWQVPRIWEGGDVWIIGGGPSVTKQFDIPDEVVNSVLSGASPANVYTPYISAIHDKHVIGINVAYLLGDWIDMVFFGDSGFLDKHLEGVAKFKGLKVTCHENHAKYDWIKYMAKDPRGRGISDNPKMVCWNNNSGAAAISVAANAGAKRIILLGFDMQLSDKNYQHWHDVYKRGNKLDENRLRKLPFARHLRGFADIKNDAKRRGLEILNCSPDSKISEFPKYSLKELLLDNS